MRQPRYAFTIVELLVVIGIIAVLMGILLPVLGRARQSARQLKSQSDLRQMLMGYMMYYQDYNGALPYGYPPPTVNGVPMLVDSPSGHRFGAPVSTRYPWRLWPYVSNVWEIIHSHTDVPPAPRAGDSASAAFGKAYTLSINPTYGINAVFVGGQYGPVYQGFAGPGGDRPNTGKHVVFKASQVRNPSRLIVFADCKVRNMPGLGDADTGLHYLTPPRARGHNWKAVNGRIEVLNPGLIMGVPEGRYASGAVTGFFDGHVESLRPEALEDMRLWANDAESAVYDF